MKEDVVHISFEDTHPVPSIIIIMSLLGVNISALSTTTLKVIILLRQAKKL
jgi:hypothetical protein